MTKTRTTRRSRLLIVFVAAFYVVAAWSVAPGFYDGFTPPTPYPFVCPPPIAGAHAEPESGHAVIHLSNGASEPASVFTNDGMFVIVFVAGSFDMAGKSTVTVDITPVSPCPNAGAVRLVTNTYLVTADATLIKRASLVMMYSNLEPDPSFVYRASSIDGPWTDIGASPQARMWTISTGTDQLGYFAAGFPSSAIAPSGNNQTILIVVAALIAAVLLAGMLPVVVRRRQARR